MIDNGTASSGMPQILNKGNQCRKQESCENFRAHAVHVDWQNDKKQEI